MSRFQGIAGCLILFATALALSSPAAAAVPEDSRWSGEFGPSELSGQVSDAVGYLGGLAVCGSLTISGSAVPSSVAWWDGSAWHELGAGPAGGLPGHLIVLGDTLIASQRLFDGSTWRYIAHLSRWDGHDWRSFGGVLDGDVLAMVVCEGQLVVGGSFANADGLPIGHVARWDGAAWRAYADGPNGSVSQLLAIGDTLVVGGDFTAPSPGMARWDGETWHEMSNGLPDGLEALCYHDGSVMAGGMEPSYYPVGWVSRWDGHAWQAQGLNGSMMAVLSLASLDGRLIVSGADFAINRWDEACGYIEVFDGGWKCIAFSYSDQYILRTWGPELVAIGVSAHIGDLVASGLAAWDGATWHALGNAAGGIVEGVVLSIANVDGTPVVGGNFHAAGSAVCGVAGWSGGGWVGHGLEGRIVGDIAFHDGHTYLVGVTGPTYMDCGTDAWRSIDYDVPHVSAWGAAGSSALAGYSGHLYIGYHACESPNVVRSFWPEGEIAPLNGEFAGALCSWSGGLYAGGCFHDVGSVPLAHVAAWDGVEWRQPGDGLDSTVCALVSWGNCLVAGGQFEHSGQVEMSRVAAWDGQAWRALGAGFNGTVNALAVVGDRLYAGGSFTASGDIPLSHVSYWDGARWRPLGSGVDGPVYALMGIGADLWAGGSFSRAGDKPSMRIARWNDDLVPVHLSAFTARRESGSAVIQWQLAEPGETSRFQLWREWNASSRTPVGTVLPADRLQYSFVDPSPPVQATAYWLQELTTGGPDNWYGPAILEAVRPPSSLRLAQNCPNPFNPRTTFNFSLPTAGRAEMAIYDVRGARVAMVVDAELPAGEQSGEWSGLDSRGVPVPSGVYFARLTTPAGVRTVKVTVAR